MGRQAPSRADAQAIRARLHKFVSSVYQGDWKSLWKAAGVDRTTAEGWRRNYRDRPGIPDAVQLIKLARGARISLDWLLLGEGEPLRLPQHSVEDVGEAFRAFLLADFTATEGHPRLLAGDEWVTLPRPAIEDWQAVMPPADTVSRLASALVRQLLRRAVWKVCEFNWRAASVGDPSKPLYGRKWVNAEMREKEARALIEALGQELRLELAKEEEGIRTLTEHAFTRVREGRIAFQVVEEATTLVPLHA
jgi:hypothetical protein